MRPNIPEDIRANLKRLCPYIGPYIPDSVRQNARSLWWRDYNPEKSGEWRWDDGSGFYQCELELCDMDVHVIDPAGYVAIRPLRGNKYALVFVLSVGRAKGFDSENLIFDSIRAAKRFLDTLLAADTPEIPLL